MNVCIPIMSDQAEQSPVSAHFGSAPAFLFIDTESGARKVKQNGNEHHEHGQCRPLDALAGEHVDAILVGGIGRGAFMGLSRAGIQVLLSKHETAGEALKALAAGELASVDPSSLCGGHGHGQGEGQGHGHQGGCGHDHGRPTNPS